MVFLITTFVFIAISPKCNVINDFENYDDIIKCLKYFFFFFYYSKDRYANNTQMIISRDDTLVRK